MDGAADQQPVFGVRPGTGTITWFHNNPARGNRHCLYCGTLVGEAAAAPSDKEHLIGRRMVPVGSMADPASFNLIFRSCVTCNQGKAALEDHVSAITLLSSAGRAEDPRIDALARRKGANSFDPRHPGKPVAAIRHQHEIKADMGGLSMSFGLISGPQADRFKFEELAFRHIQGLFALVTSEDPRRSETTRLLPSNHFGLFGYYPLRDWGNPQLKAVAERVKILPRHAEITTADGYFRATLRRAAEGSPWFWALEWNASFRLAGWIGEQAARPAFFEDLPEHQWLHSEPIANNGVRRVRLEVPLRDDDPDPLFDPVI